MCKILWYSRCCKVSWKSSLLLTKREWNISSNALRSAWSTKKAWILWSPRLTWTILSLLALTIWWLSCSSSMGLASVGLLKKTASTFLTQEIFWLKSSAVRWVLLHQAQEKKSWIEWSTTRSSSSSWMHSSRGFITPSGNQGICRTQGCFSVRLRYSKNCFRKMLLWITF